MVETGTAVDIQGRRSEQRGVTLVEVLLALAIVGLAASVVVLNSPPSDRQVRREAERFAARLAAAQDEALLSGRPVGLDPAAGGYRFLRYADDEWTLMTGRVLGTWRLREDVLFSIAGESELPLAENDRVLNRSNRRIGGQPDDNEKDRATPAILFTPTGTPTPLTASFTGSRERWEVRMAEDGAIDIVQLQPSR